jgi:peptide/nickel transport system substrate-binding protein
LSRYCREFHLSNPEIDQLFANGAVATPDSRRKEVYEKAQKILVEDVPVAWMLELRFRPSRAAR